MSGRSKLWISAAAGLVCAQAVASLFLHPSFTLIALSDLAQLILLFSGTISLLPSIFATRGRVRVF